MVHGGCGRVAAGRQSRAASEKTAHEMFVEICTRVGTMLLVNGRRARIFVKTRFPPNGTRMRISTMARIPPGRKIKSTGPNRVAEIRWISAGWEYGYSIFLHFYSF